MSIWKAVAAIARVTLFVGAPISCANAQTTNLVCGGEFHEYEPRHVESTVAPTAATVDIANSRITTPLGMFRITSVSEAGVGFEDAGNNRFKVTGYVDRVSGQMTISWRRPEEEAKVQAGMPAHNSMFAELACSAAKRLF